MKMSIRQANMALTLPELKDLLASHGQRPEPYQGPSFCRPSGL